MRFEIQSLPHSPFGALTLVDHEGQSSAIIAPERGGMIARWNVRGTEVLFLDQESYLDTSRNVRGGNPVLFPTPGKLKNDTWNHHGRSGKLKQHGFARLETWKVVERSTSDAASVTLRLESSPNTLKDYPWDFCADFAYALCGDALSISMKITNTGQETMPFGVGFHPYFQVPQALKADTTIETQATWALDNTNGSEIEFQGFQLGHGETDLHLHDHGSTQSSLQRPDQKHAVRLEGDENFSHWVVWTLEGRDFVCLEPWTCPGNALNDKDRLFFLPPGATKTLHLRYLYR